MAITIFTDSTCDLSNEQIKENNIKIIPLHVSVPSEGDYLDGIDINSELLYDKVEKTGNLPKTGAINVNEFIEAFKVEIGKGNEVFYTGIGSGLSSTYQNALLAINEFPEGKVMAVDSKSLSTGIGLLVLKACKLKDEGKSLKEIVDELNETVPQLSVKFCIDRLDYLYKGGRCSGLTKLVAHALKIHPIAKVTNNELKVAKMPRGTLKKGIALQIEEFKNDLLNIDLEHVFITHSGRMDDLVEETYNEIKDLVPEGHLHVTRAGCTISSHCGPRTLGILYILKK